MIVCDLCLTVLMLTLKRELNVPIFVKGGQLIGNMLKFLKICFLTAVLTGLSLKLIVQY